MVFHSLAFFYFFIIVYGVSLALSVVSRQSRNPSLPFKIHKLFLLAASYYFYGYWDYRFLSLMIFSTSFNFWAGSRISRTDAPDRRKSLFILTLAVNLGLLGFFKYCNFFIDSANFVLKDLNIAAARLDIVLPLGISFYTFHSLSYIIDIYFRRFEASRSFSDFALFVAFFPQLVAGPIVRASQLLPQFRQPSAFSGENLFKGFQIFLYGLFLKVVVADNVAPLVDPIFKNPEAYDSLAVWVAVIGYSAQIFCDFCGYSEMAIGVALCFGYVLPVNFRMPYLATDLFDFWRRWHISLTSWLRDYLYIPLGGNQKGLTRTCVNIFIVMFLGGLWHGAKWTFALWGIYHGLGMLANRVLSAAFGDRVKPGPLVALCKWAATYLFVCFGWVLFRAENLDAASRIYSKMLSFRPLDVDWGFLAAQTLFFVPCMIAIHLWFYLTQRESMFFRAGSFASHLYVVLMVFLVFLFAPLSYTGFIYFQF